MNCIHKYKNIYTDIGLLVVSGVVVVERGDLLHIHLLKCVHKCTDICNTIDMLVLKGMMVVDRGGVHSISVYISISF